MKRGLSAVTVVVGMLVGVAACGAGDGGTTGAAGFRGRS